MSKEEILTALLSGKVLTALKIITSSLVVSIIRAFHDKEEFSVRNIMIRTITALALMTITFNLLKEFTSWSDDTRLMLAGIVGLAAKEILDLILKIAENPSQGIKLFKGKDVDFKDKSGKLEE